MPITPKVARFNKLFLKKINLSDLSRSPTLSKLHLITNSHNIHFVYLHMSLKVFLRISKTEEIKIFCFTRI